MLKRYEELAQPTIKEQHKYGRRLHDASDYVAVCRALAQASADVERLIVIARNLISEYDEELKNCCMVHNLEKIEDSPAMSEARAAFAQIEGNTAQ